MQTAYITHPLCLMHDMGENHPEAPARLGAIEEQLLASGVLDFLQQDEAPEATREQLLRVHDATYIDFIAASVPQRGRIALDGDTAMNPFSYRAALRAAGAVVRGVDRVMEGAVTTVFCNIRPPGHHAERSRAMGFCLFNNLAVGVAHALAQYGLQRVAIVDFDVHHGNGTEQMFHDDPRVLFCSTFQHPFYPYTGLDSGNDHIIPVPLPAGTDSTGFRAAVTQQILPALERFQPELLFCSAGFDAHREDEMALLNLVEADYAWVTREIQHLAQRYAQGRIVSVLEGGYELSALARSALAHIKGLSGL